MLAFVFTEEGFELVGENLSVVVQGDELINYVNDMDLLVTSIKAHSDKLREYLDLRPITLRSRLPIREIKEIIPSFKTLNAKSIFEIYNRYYRYYR